MSIQHISALELHTLIEKGLPADCALIDVRTSAECEKGMIRGAKHISVDRIAEHVSQFAPYKKLYLYCLSGGRSDIAAATLLAQGYTGELYSLTSGVLAWRKEGYNLG